MYYPVPPVNRYRPPFVPKPSLPVYESRRPPAGDNGPADYPSISNPENSYMYSEQPQIMPPSVHKVVPPYQNMDFAHPDGERGPPPAYDDLPRAYSDENEHRWAAIQPPNLSYSNVEYVRTAVPSGFPPPVPPSSIPQPPSRPPPFVKAKGEPRLVLGENGYLGSTVYVFHIPSVWGDSELACHFAPFGRIVKSGVFFHPEMSTHRGFGFVTFSHPREALNSLRGMNGFHIHGTVKRLRVEIKRGEEPFLKHALGLGIDDHLPL